MNYYYCLECGEIYETQNTMVECGQCGDCDIMSIHKADYDALLNDNTLLDITSHSNYLTEEEVEYLEQLFDRMWDGYTTQGRVDYYAQ